MEQDNLLEGIDLDLPAAVAPAPFSRPAASSLIEGPGSSLERQFLGPYELISRIGSGGVAIVYRARHMHPGYTDKPLAIKVLHEHLSEDPQVVEMFRREARVLSLIKHANVVDTFEAGVQDGRMFLAMEYVDGRDLEILLWRASQLRLAVPQAVYLHVVAEVLRGLTYAHALRDYDDVALGVVHRDVNPANVFIAFDGQVKLGDFGVTQVLAQRQKKQREVAGKVGYFAPEQLAGATTQAQADIFAVGAMLFEILCGRKLFDGDNTQKIMRANAAADVPDMAALNANLSAELIALTRKALARKPEERFANAQAMLDALQPFLPERRAVSLALRSLMRTAFVLDHSKELALRAQMRDPSQLPQIDRPLVDVVTADADASVALTQLLSREGFSPRLHSETASLFAAQAEAPAHVVLWGLPPEPILAGHAPGFLLPAAHVIAMGRVLDTATLAWADALGARDLLFKPLPPERVLTAVRAAVAAAQAQAAQLAPPVPKRLRMALITQDAQLAQRWRETFAPLGYQVTLLADAASALSGTNRHSYELVALHTGVLAGGHSAFIEAYRAAPGMGIVPVLLLCDSQAQCDPGLWPPRTRPVLADGPWGTAVDEALRGPPGGNARTYDRFDTTLPVQLRFGGRVFDARAVNISRGGMLLHTAHLPSIGTELGLAITLGDGARVEAQGTALRVLLQGQPGEDAAGARIGIALRTFVGDGEAHFIAHIEALAALQAQAAQEGLSARTRGWFQGLQRA